MSSDDTYNVVFIVVGLLGILPFVCFCGIVCCMMYCAHKQQQAYMQQSPGPVFVVQAPTPGAAPQHVVPATPSRATPQSHTSDFE